MKKPTDPIHSGTNNKNHALPKHSQHVNIPKVEEEDNAKQSPTTWPYA